MAQPTKAARHPTAEETAAWRDSCAHLCEIIEDAMEDYTEPADTAGAGWHSPLWQVVRAAKAHPLLRQRDGYAAWQLVRQLVDVDDLLAADSRLTDEDDVAAAWADAHDKVRYLPGEDLLGAAVREAEQSPVAPPRDRGSGYARFVAMVAAYVRLRATVAPTDQCTWDVVAIPVERWAGALGARPNTVSIWRRWAVDDGILTLTAQYSRERRRASEYRANVRLLRPTKGTL